MFVRQMKLKKNLTFYSPVHVMTIYVFDNLLFNELIERYVFFKDLDINSNIFLSF